MTPEFFNVEAYRAFLDTVPDDDDPACVREASRDIDIGWWFLRKNSVFNVNGNVVIHFGMGESEHTLRDFRITLDVLKQFFTRPHSVKFYAAEEGDGYKTTFVWPVEFTKGYDN